MNEFAGLAVTGGPVTTLVAAMIATAEGAAASAAQTSISAAINHKKLSAGNVLESAGIGAGMALGADLIGEGLGYATGKGIENLTSTSSEGQKLFSSSSEGQKLLSSSGVTLEDLEGKPNIKQGYLKDILSKYNESSDELMGTVYAIRRAELPAQAALEKTAYKLAISKYIFAFTDKNELLGYFVEGNDDLQYEFTDVYKIQGCFEHATLFTTLQGAYQNNVK